MRTIAVVNQKGGCGKTITAINLSAFLALAGRRVLLVDMDPQGHSTLGLPGGEGAPTRTMYDVFLNRIRGSDTTLADVTRPVGENFDLAPADILLSAVPEALAGAPGRENVLAWAVARMDDRYDYVIVDCPPNVGLLTFNALKACNEAVIPMDPSFFSLHGIGKLFETFDLLERETGHRISARVLVTLYPGRAPFVKAVVDDVHRHLAGRQFETVVRYSVKLAEAASHGLPITRYARYSAGFEDYQALAGEVLRQEIARGTAEPGLAAAPEVTPEGVVFTVEAPNAAQVQVAGDFNDWKPARGEMELAGRVWKRTLKLAPGRYRYRYVIDSQWCRDVHNPLVEPSPFGGDDSLLVLEEPQVLQPVTAPTTHHEPA
jgi:chromosome partitioning protein